MPATKQPQPFVQWIALSGEAVNVLLGALHLLGRVVGIVAAAALIGLFIYSMPLLLIVVPMVFPLFRKNED